MLLGAGVLVAAGAVGVTVALWPVGDASPGTDAGSDIASTGAARSSDTAGAASSASTASRAPAPASPSPSPARVYPLSKTPRTIPAVREHVPARGPGWRPASTARVVVGAGALADEGKLLAGELRMTYGGTAAPRAGDVQLKLDPAQAAKGAESYTLTVKSGRVTVAGPAEAGVFYGTRTLKQEVSGGSTAPEGVVRDRPAKAQRGLMLDIARKHFTASWIKDRVRELGDLKFNELGLHFSDDQGFRIASDSHPEIVSADHLTKAEVRDILALAASRHITVVPEIDSPGHLGAVLAAHPDLQLRNAQGTAARGAIDISKPESAKIVDDLLGEYADLFTGASWNLGGDEYRALTVSSPATSYPQLAAAATQKYGAGAGVSDLATGWLNDRAATVRAHGRTALRAWNDGFYQSSSVQPGKNIQVAYWTGKEIGARQPAGYLSAGRKVVNYNDEYLYYVLGQPNTFVYPTGERIYKQWTPRVLRGSTAVSSAYDGQILGGVFAVWCDLSGSQTQNQVAAGIRMPLRATVQKLWDPRAQPPLSWTDFKKLAGRLG
ncbi:glycoside hydrolase family 20 protein [Streptomyces sp. WI04-05B]|uniref:beta-N-acetylhexosaminidase n=1 Tax=Streptomyces TaxID=1883 RepID=UPI0029B57519|nr:MULTISPECIES: glycoside hydrolase family 20 protein [unclassified Streptomyces]MDX2544005.1 glycoside hydrolase family 20 protein [Streptomyces sp. WI04-05B]MDX2584285.1 glycoside hydrolase family 20 protein [Streptomyces sp. WI04-05A]